MIHCKDKIFQYLQEAATAEIGVSSPTKQNWQCSAEINKKNVTSF
jgi:hypothetical protein